MEGLTFDRASTLRDCYESLLQCMLFRRPYRSRRLVYALQICQ